MRILFVFAAFLCSACSSTATPLPKGPPPEYEQEPVADAPDASTDAATPPSEAK